MGTKYIDKKGVKPTSYQLTQNDIVINRADQILYFKDVYGKVKSIGNGSVDLAELKTAIAGFSSSTSSPEDGVDGRTSWFDTEGPIFYVKNGPDYEDISDSKMYGYFVIDGETIYSRVNISVNPSNDTFIGGVGETEVDTVHSDISVNIIGIGTKQLNITFTHVSGIQVTANSAISVSANGLNQWIHIVSGPVNYVKTNGTWASTASTYVRAYFKETDGTLIWRQHRVYLSGDNLYEAYDTKDDPNNKINESDTGEGGKVMTMTFHHTDGRSLTQAHTSNVTVDGDDGINGDRGSLVFDVDIQNTGYIDTTPSTATLGVSTWKETAKAFWNSSYNRVDFIMGGLLPDTTGTLNEQVRGDTFHFYLYKNQSDTSPVATAHVVCHTESTTFDANLWDFDIKLYVDGSLLVEGTIYADALDANAISGQKIDIDDDNPEAYSGVLARFDSSSGATIWANNDKGCIGSTKGQAIYGQGAIGIFGEAKYYSGCTSFGIYGRGTVSNSYGVGGFASNGSRAAYYALMYNAASSDIFRAVDYTSGLELFVVDGAGKLWQQGDEVATVRAWATFTGAGDLSDDINVSGVSESGTAIYTVTLSGITITTSTALFADLKRTTTNGASVTIEYASSTSVIVRAFDGYGVSYLGQSVISQIRIAIIQ